MPKLFSMKSISFGYIFRIQNGKISWKNQGKSSTTMEVEASKQFHPQKMDAHITNISYPQ
jgi:hypothetical protein